MGGVKIFVCWFVGIDCFGYIWKLNYNFKNIDYEQNI